jgi:uncharacterized protein YkwD
MRGFLIWLVLSILFLGSVAFNKKYGLQHLKIGRPVYYTSNPSPTPMPKRRSISKNNIVVPKEQLTPDKWGVAKQIDDVTWTIKVGQDAKMATPQEIFQALNAYRNRHGSASLSWDDNLANFAQERAAYFNKIKSLDQHKGFIEYTENEDNIKKLGFWGVGENASFGYKLEGVHLIEWIFAGDEPHNKNQLEPSWTYVGIGVEGVGVDLIFGKWKM